MSDTILSQILAEYAQKRLKNQQEEEKRLEEIKQTVPAAAVLVEKRRDFLFSQLRKVIHQQGEENLQTEETMENYNRKIREALINKKYPSDYLQPIFDCSICKDTGYVGEPLKKRCVCLEKAYHHRVREDRGLYQGVKESFDTYDEKVYSDEVIPGLGVSQRMYMANIKERVYQYGKNFPQNPVPDMLFVGKSGLGKTFLLQALAQQVQQKGYQVVYVTSYRFIELARQAHFTNQWDLLDSILTCDLLLIDDLGIEPMMENITIIQLFRTIDERQREGKSTVISTNLNSVELQNRYSERIASRLLNPRQCDLVAFLGEDVRRREG